MKNSHHSTQRGVSLIESLVAIVVMAMGILGILGVQMRTLTENQTSVKRAQAIRLIEDLSERMKVNPNSLADLNLYVTSWNSTPSGTCPGCAQHSQLAAADLLTWKTSVWNTLSPNSTLPTDPARADANIFIVADETNPAIRRQLGVMISWRENEKTNTADYINPLATSSTGGAGVTCPAGKTCHLQYIQLTSRCTPYTQGGPTDIKVFCPI